MHPVAEVQPSATITNGQEASGHPFAMHTDHNFTVHGDDPIATNNAMETGAQDTSHQLQQDARTAFLQSSASLLADLSTPAPAPALPPTSDKAMLLLAQSMVEAQAPRPTFADFATVPKSHPFDH